MSMFKGLYHAISIYFLGFIILSFAYWLYVTFSIYNIILWGCCLILVLITTLFIMNELNIIKLNKIYTKRYNDIAGRLKEHRVNNIVFNSKDLLKAVKKKKHNIIYYDENLKTSKGSLAKILAKRFKNESRNKK